jgi:hypothetical protein
MERVHPGEVALALEEGLGRVNLEWEGVALEQVQVLEENASVQNAERLSPMKQEHHAPL